jgi:hypothetical protein
MRKVMQRIEAEDIAARMHQAQVAVAKALGTYERPVCH